MTKDDKFMTLYGIINNQCSNTNITDPRTCNYKVDNGCADPKKQIKKLYPYFILSLF